MDYQQRAGGKKRVRGPERRCRPKYSQVMLVGAEGFEPVLRPPTKTRTFCDLGAKQERVWTYPPSIPSLPSPQSTQGTRFPGIFVSFVSLKNERESVEKLL